MTGAVVTADALHTTREAAEFLVTLKHADYLFTVKANRPALLERCQRLAWHQVPMLDRTRDQAHGRVEIRTLKAVSVRGFGFPTPSRSSRLPARSATLAAAGGAPRPPTRSPAWSTPRPAPPGWPTTSAGTGRSRRCTTSATPPLPRTPPRCALDPPRRSWRPCATWPSACCAAPGRSPRRRVAPPQPQPLPTPGHPRHQHRMNRTSRKNPPKPRLALRQTGLRRVGLAGVARALGPVDQNTVGHGPGRNPITDTRLDAVVSLLDQEFQHRRLPRLDH